MQRTENSCVEQNSMHLLLIALSLFAFWTAAHQFSTFIGISWITLTQAVAWLLLPAIVLTYWQAGHLAKLYVQYLPTCLFAPSGPPTPYMWLVCLCFLGSCLLFGSFMAQYALVILSITAITLFAWHNASASEALTARPSYDELSSQRTYLYLFGLMSLTVLIVLCANRSDFDDAEYIQFAIQTLRHPERGLFTFDASLGMVLEQFRFAPYRITSYETFIGLITQWTGLNILDVYYLLMPATSAALSILVAFVFLRWFLPLRWSLLAILLFLLISFAWGETHVAYGNRMYVRLFQGKGLLIAITTPLTIIMALIWMRKPSAHAWFGLLIMQVLAVGVSSSGLVITLFSTALGLLAGFLAQPCCKGLWAASAGGATLAYPIGLGLWIKYISSASGKVEEIGTYLPINASLGGTWREALALTIMVSACFLKARIIGRPIQIGVSSRLMVVEKTYFWLVAISFLLILNPLLIEYLTTITSKNMNWRLAWAAPVPLLLAVSLAYLLHWAQEKNGSDWKKTAWLLPIGLIVTFATVNPWTLAKSNQVHWGILDRKLPPEYQQAVDLAQDIRKQTKRLKVITVLVDPRVGTWLTVVAPDFKLIMPGHGYWVTLKTIMDNQDFEQRNRLVKGIDAIVAGDDSLNKLLDSYGVNVIAVKITSKLGPDKYRIQIRSINDAAAKS